MSDSAAVPSIYKDGATEVKTTTPGQGGSKRPTSERRLRAKQKQAEAVKLRLLGASFDQIAEQLGYVNRGSAYRAVIAGVAEWGKEPVEQLRQVEGARLDELRLRLMAEIRKGRLEHVDRYLRLSDRYAQLMGLDMPKRLEIITEDAVDAEIRRLEAEVSRLAGDVAPQAAAGQGT